MPHDHLRVVCRQLLLHKGLVDDFGLNLDALGAAVKPPEGLIALLAVLLHFGECTPMYAEYTTWPSGVLVKVLPGISQKGDRLPARLGLPSPCVLVVRHYGEVGSLLLLLLWTQCACKPACAWSAQEPLGMSSPLSLDWLACHL